MVVIVSLDLSYIGKLFFGLLMEQINGGTKISVFRAHLYPICKVIICISGKATLLLS